MVRRLIGRDAMTVRELSLETGLGHSTLSYWLKQARTVTPMRNGERKVWSVEEKARIIAAAGQLSAEELLSFLEKEGVPLAELERWRGALNGDAPEVASKRVRQL